MTSIPVFLLKWLPFPLMKERRYESLWILLSVDQGRTLNVKPKYSTIYASMKIIWDCTIKSPTHALVVSGSPSAVNQQSHSNGRHCVAAFTGQLDFYSVVNLRFDRSQKNVLQFAIFNFIESEWMHTVTFGLKLQPHKFQKGWLNFTAVVFNFPNLDSSRRIFQ